MFFFFFFYKIKFFSTCWFSCLKKLTSLRFTSVIAFLSLGRLQTSSFQRQQIVELFRSHNLLSCSQESWSHFSACVKYWLLTEGHSLTETRSHKWSLKHMMEMRRNHTQNKGRSFVNIQREETNITSCLRNYFFRTKKEKEKSKTKNISITMASCTWIAESVSAAETITVNTKSVLM